jgi:2-polyprenyl-3-methyl-5-hydroxy-6-metoxy-1,4-benzoquinol methylase
LLALRSEPITCWGYDFQPANVSSAPRRGVDVRYANFLQDDVEIGDVAVCTECLEHLEDPHAFLARLAGQVKALVCSSPMNESDVLHDSLHAWAWDVDGYKAMLTGAGFQVIETRELWPFQIHLAVTA